MAADGNGDIEYVGRALPGIADDAPGWQITKYTTPSAITEGKLAGKSNIYDKIWDDHAGYTYG